MRWEGVDGQRPKRSNKHKQQQNKKTAFRVSTGLHVDHRRPTESPVQSTPWWLGRHAHISTNALTCGTWEGLNLKLAPLCSRLPKLLTRLRECGGVQGSWKNSKGCVCSEIQVLVRAQLNEI